jgi:hypothetical protein
LVLFEHPPQGSGASGLHSHFTQYGPRIAWSAIG